MKYIHIPKHAMKDFRDFAKGVAAQACQEVATCNPYVQALNRHRKELQSSLGVWDGDEGEVGEQPTLEQQLSTHREALSTLSTVKRSTSASVPFFLQGCGHVEAESPCRKPWHMFSSGAPLTPLQCCTSRGDTGDAPDAPGTSPVLTGGGLSRGLQHPQELVYPLPALAGTNPAGLLAPASPASVLSGRSVLSTTCSRHSAGEADSGGRAESSASSAPVAAAAAVNPRALTLPSL